MAKFLDYYYCRGRHWFDHQDSLKVVCGSHRLPSEEEEERAVQVAAAAVVVEGAVPKEESVWFDRHRHRGC